VRGRNSPGLVFWAMMAGWAAAPGRSHIIAALFIPKLLATSRRYAKTKTKKQARWRRPATCGCFFAGQPDRAFLARGFGRGRSPRSPAAFHTGFYGEVLACTPEADLGAKFRQLGLGRRGWIAALTLTRVAHAGAIQTWGGRTLRVGGSSTILQKRVPDSAIDLFQEGAARSRRPLRSCSIRRKPWWKAKAGALSST